LGSALRAELIPAARLYTWTPGTTVGVDGGIAQYFNGSGDADERSTASLVNAVTAHSADNTGATATHAAILAAWSASTSGTGVYLPPGVYKITSTLNLGTNSDNRTLRGAGSAVRSTSSNTLAATGTKTFTVPASVGWTTGCGVRAWKRNDPKKWMMGTVSSYSGTTLEMSVSSSSGDTDTLSDWSISMTYILGDANPAILVGTTGDAYNYMGGGTYGFWSGGGVATVGSAAKGDTSIVVADATGMAAGQLMVIALLNNATEAAFLAGESTVFGYGSSGAITGEYLRRHLVRIGSGYTSGTTIPLDVPLAFALPAALSPKVYATGTYADKVGIEDLAIFCGTGVQTGVYFQQTVNCWTYNVIADRPNNYGHNWSAAYKCEIRKSVSLSSQRGDTESNGGGFLGNNLGHCLVADNIFYGNFPAIEINNGTTACAFIGNFTGNPPGYGNINSNHGPHNSFNLYEYNIGPSWQSDGYFGSQSNDTVSRNWITGAGTDLTYGLIVSNRGAYNNNFVGNVLGTASSRDGLFSYGNPNMGNGDNSGLDFQPYVDGSFYRHWEGTGLLTGTVTNQTSRTFTLDTLTGASLQTPHIDASRPVTTDYVWVVWGSWTSRLQTAATISNIAGSVLTFSGAAANISITGITRSGSTATVTTSGAHGLTASTAVELSPIYISGADQADYNGAFSIVSIPDTTSFTITVANSPATPATGTMTCNTWPASGYAMVINPRGQGYQERDLQTSATAIQKGNYLVVGAGGSQESNLAGDTVPDSFAYAARPDWWPSSLTYPGVNPASPTFSNAIIPAGYRYTNGEDAPSGGGTANATVNQLNVGTLNIQ